MGLEFWLDFFFFLFFILIELFFVVARYFRSIFQIEVVWCFSSLIGKFDDKLGIVECRFFLLLVSCSFVVYEMGLWNIEKIRKKKKEKERGKLGILLMDFSMKLSKVFFLSSSLWGFINMHNGKISQFERSLILSIKSNLEISPSCFLII